MTGVHKLRLAAFVLAVLTVLAAFLGGRPRRAPAHRDPAGATGADAEVAARPGEFRRKNPFRIQRVRPPPAPSPEPQAVLRPPPPKASEPPPSLPLKLVGTIDAGRSAMAFFTGAGPRQLALEAAADLGEELGERFRGLILAEIHRKKVVIRGQGRELVLELGEDGPAVSEAAPATPGADAAPEAAAPPVAGDEPPSEVELSQVEVQRSLSNLAYLVTQAQAQPYFEAGLPAGVRVSRIRPGSVPARMGLQNGDVLRGVDGRPIQTMEDSVQLLGAFRSKPELTVDVLRGGRVRTIRYRIR